MTEASPEPTIEAPAAPTRPANSLDMLESRIDAMVAGKADKVAPQEEPEPVALTVVPPSDEPELPIPSPAAAQPAFALVRDVPEAIAATEPPPVVEPEKPVKAAPAHDPLAGIMALSEVERIALFT